MGVKVLLWPAVIPAKVLNFLEFDDPPPPPPKVLSLCSVFLLEVGPTLSMIQTRLYNVNLILHLLPSIPSMIDDDDDSVFFSFGAEEKRNYKPNP